jgi:hypothetical protein
MNVGWRKRVSALVDDRRGLGVLPRLALFFVCKFFLF